MYTDVEVDMSDRGNNAKVTATLQPRPVAELWGPIVIDVDFSFSLQQSAVHLQGELQHGEGWGAADYKDTLTEPRIPAPISS